MSDLVLLYVLGGATLVSGVIAGVFFTFSDFIMRSFTLASDSAGAEVMQQINRVIYRSGFMVILLGMVPVSAALALVAYLWLDGGAVLAVYSGSALYLVGMFFVTVVGNVPMNNRLDALPLSDGSAQNYWSSYRVNWTLLNHIRSIATIASAACYGIATILLALTM